MYRAAASKIRTLKCQGGNRNLTRFASSSAVAAKSSSEGIFSWFTGGSSSSLPPLDFPLKGIELPAALPDRVETENTKITTLPNGVRIASENSSNPAASIGLYVNSGSIYETPLSFGATHLLERMAFKGTANRSHLRLVREVEAIGGTVMASASRDQMSYTYDALKTYVPQMVELLVDSVRNQVFLDWEVKEQIEKVKGEISEYANNPEALLLEAVHSAGYSGALANPLFASEGSLNRLDSNILEQFVAANYTAPRIVLAASGVEHEELLKYAEPLLSDLPGGAQVEEPKSVYVGGEHRVMADTGRTSFALAFELPGGWLNVKDAMTMTVLQMLMGGGGSFSAGGPGKGMHSRLYLRVLNEYPEIQSFSAFNSIYNKTAIFGIQGTTSPEALDRISSLPPYIIQHILTLMPLRDAFRTSILSQNWRCHCRYIPKLWFDSFFGPNDETSSNKCTILHNVVYPILLLHRGPILKFTLDLYGLNSCCEIDQIILYLSRNPTLKEFTLWIHSGDEHKLLPAFFKLQQLTVLELFNCAFQPPVTFKGFSRLVKLYFFNVSIAAKDFLRIISNCPLLKDFTLIGDENHFLGSWSSNFIELFERLPLLEHLCMSSYPIQCFATGGIPQKLPTSLVHLKSLTFFGCGLCFGREVDLRSILLLVTSSPNIETIRMEMENYPTEAVSQTTMNLVDHQDYTHVILDHLRVIEIFNFSNMKTGMDFVKLILAKSSMLKKVLIDINEWVDIHGRVNILTEMIQYPRASTKAEIKVY